MRLPDFLIIGAMKAGTTTLYSDLANSCGVFFPIDKEPNNLAHSDVVLSRGRAAYAALFAAAHGGQLCGDASTIYSKLPDIEGVPERALQVLGEDLRIIYLVRDPVERALSHHRHLVARRRAPASIDAAVRRIPGLVEYGQYARQLRPWIDRFGLERICVVRFETYVEERVSSLARVASFLGARFDPAFVDPFSVHNQSQGSAVASGLRAWALRSRPYRRLRQRLSPDLRARLRDAILRKAAERPGPPNLSTLEYLVGRLTPDVKELQHILSLDAPPWEMSRHLSSNEV